ncbi:MAG: DMT family transporter [Pseudomonadota bacterium]
MPVHLKLIIACVFWGTTPTVGRMVAGFEAPMVMVFFRFLFACLLLVLLAYRAKAFVALSPAQWIRVLFLGLTGVLLHNGFMFWGMEFTNASVATIILALIAIQVALIDWAFFRQVPELIAVVGIVLGLLGAVLVICEGDLSELKRVGIGFGEVLIFLSALAWSVYSVLGRPLLINHSPLAVSNYACLVGLALLVPFAASDLETTLSVANNLEALGWLAFLGLFGSGIGFVWYYEAVVKMGAMETALYLNLMPISGVLSAVWLLDEKLHWSLYAGGTLVIIGLILVNRGEQSAPVEPVGEVS